MNLADITTKCYILALIIRDDGERLLLGDGAYEFKDSQQHFIANTYANDVVELQGTDGQMLAGQVRRTATQTFAGYIGDATFSKQAVESARRDFLMFFRKKHYYTAVYVFSDGTAIQRDRGYIVNAPSVPELYQRFPEWSVGLNFEDPNYYEYAEDDLGHEIAAHKVELELSTAMSGGLIWDEDGAVSDDLSYVGTEIEGEGKNFQLADTGTATLKSAELLGNATQTTYSGKNLIKVNYYSATNQTITYYRQHAPQINTTLEAGVIYTFSADVTIGGSVSSCRLNIGCGSTAFQKDIAGITVTSGRASVTFTPTAEQLANGRTNFYFRFPCITGTTEGVNFSFSNVMLEKSATATSYEPYVGGTASPNPDFPQPISVVTGQQTVNITGKNQFNPANIVGANITVAGDTLTLTNSGGYNVTAEGCTLGTICPNLVVGQTYVLSFDTTETSVSHHDDIYIRSASNYWTKGTPRTLTQTDIASRIAFYGTNATVSNIQLELGSTATAYEPYQGQEFEVNLGSIELAKIGNYQDRIYKDDGKWYIEKQVGKVVFNGTENWTLGYTGTPNFMYVISNVGGDAEPSSGQISRLLKSNYGTDGNVGATNTDEGILIIVSTAQLRVRYGSELSIDAWKAKLASNNMILYYALATPTTTEITNSELVGQLERLRHAHTYADTTNFSITATSPNLPAFLKVVAFGDDATPQGGYVWEDGGAGGATTITVDGVDNAQPIWTVVGPATNPSLTNITTGESIQWTGVVPNGQTLVVNMADMTASLSGANVFEFISGSWITLQAGNNRVSYSATAATGIATLEWNGVVG